MDLKHFRRPFSVALAAALVAASAAAVFSQSAGAAPTATAATATDPQADPIRIGSGEGEFTFSDAKGDPHKRMTIYTYLPKGQKADTARIVFVMHGQGKNAEGYRRAWKPYADKYGLLVIAPLFDRENWGSTYTSGQFFVKDGKPTDAAKWSFNVVEHLFDAVKTATGNNSARYYLYGHSEGGQFVHRLVLFLPEARYAKAVAANPGWYTMPDLAVKFPYGLAHSPATEASLKQSLERNLILLLGSRDIDSDHPQLRKTPEAMAQGRFRLERGQTFFKAAREQCAALKCRFGWTVGIVEGAAHSNSEMSGAAAAALMGTKEVR